ncbi:3-Deoxy-D-manno-octulosonic-acid transferase family protein [Chlamydia ibidis]|uniref:3-deoxy-D-manno-octulosonic acid transferase n=2 Tax=Chlamydia ibidis TaxID=1405396 RepID=S7KH81_9CHLA|nr:lipid IV(A) 3-deoxy-D-manno-octulosonic acid transferase [Chlamydia ibidis]EPP35541.1 3-Deoxy-D-manno-octulosonic-acid transferase family protein [Chlamydia ibidis]EQM62657.1 3-Deoxy-D-manno-octulosonic-acid transferase family protein [Chlamydia ibidis 10-1398/6]
MRKSGLKQLYTWLYDAFLVCAFVVALPRIAYKVIVHGKYIRTSRVRFGLDKPKICSSRPIVWFHGASVGEVCLLQPVIEKFNEEYPDWHIVVTACSESGVESAKRLFQPLGATTFILPLDLSIIIKPVVRLISPKLVVFSEGDCWLNFLEEVKRIGAIAVVINGKVSETSCKWFTILKRFGRNYFKPIDGFLLQDEKYKTRFLHLGVSKEKLFVTGNIKTFTKSESLTDRRNNWRSRLSLHPEDQLLVLGSIHPREMDIWSSVISSINNRNFKVLWVPRHIEKAKELLVRLSKKHIKSGVWSKGDTFSDSSSLIIDVIGLLKNLYCAADLAFVGGTFDPKVGGHNLLEPLQCEVPLLFGPYVQSQSQLAMRLIDYGAGYRLHEDRIRESVEFLLDHPEERAAYIHKGKAFLSEESMSFYRTWEKLKTYIPCTKI